MRSSLVTRSAAAAKAQNAASVLKTKLSNGLTVVSEEKNGGVSQLVLAFRGGSRYQTAAQSGLVHHIRNFVGRDAQSYPGLQLVWSSAASGGNLTSFTTRDVFGVQLTVAREHAAYALSILGHVAAKPAFKAWEIEDVTPTVLADLAHKTPYGVVFEDVHRAAFRNDTLGSSLYASKSEVGTLKSDELSKFAAKHFVSGNGVLVGVNVDGSVLQGYAEESGVISDGPLITNHQSPFRGGDYRRFARTNSVHLMIAGSGASINDLKGRAIQSVFLQHIGRVSPLQFATLPGTKSALSSLPEGITGSSFEAPYDGSGLVGVYLIASPGYADVAVRNTVEALRNGKVTDLEGCKRRAITSALFSSESSSLSALEHAINSLYKGPTQSELIAEIGNVTAKDVEEFAKSAFERLAISWYGNGARIPYSDEL